MPFSNGQTLNAATLNAALSQLATSTLTNAVMVYFPAYTNLAAFTAALTAVGVTLGPGMGYFDQTLGYPVMYNGTSWNGLQES